MVGRKLLTQKKFSQPPRRSSVASAITLAPGWVRITCAIFLRWIPRAIPDFVASGPAVSELYWGEKCLHVCPKIPNLGPRLGRSTLLTSRARASAWPPDRALHRRVVAVRHAQAPFIIRRAWAPASGVAVGLLDDDALSNSSVHTDHVALRQ